MYAFPELPKPNDQDSDSRSDFTYKDTTGMLAALLDTPIDRPKTFLLEVKTSRDAENGFVFSSKQFKTVLK